MKKLALCILTLGVASSAFGAACVSAALSTYDVGGFSCNVGSFTFNNFSYIALNVLSTNVPASQIIVNPTAGVNGPNVTFTPSTPFTASGVASVADYIFGFTVTSTNPLIGFKSVDLNTTGDTTGLGVAAVVEADCYGGLLQLPNIVTGIVGLGCLSGGVAVGATATLPGGGVPLGVNANIVFDGETTTVDVLKDVTLAGALLGTATVTGVGQQFTTQTNAVPEPASFFMGGCGLIALALVGRRKMKGSVKTN
jgi:hypothetical protein